MEQLNKIEIIGRVGHTTAQRYSDKIVTRFSLCSTSLLADKNGSPIIETLWINVTSWTKEVISKGMEVKVQGRLRRVPYSVDTDKGLEERHALEIYANNVEIINE